MAPLQKKTGIFTLSANGHYQVSQSQNQTHDCIVIFRFRRDADRLMTLYRACVILF